MAQDFDVDAMIQRFQARARAVRQRGMPPIEGADRKRFVDQARVDFMDYAMIGDAVPHLDEGVLTLTIDLRPKAKADVETEHHGRSDGQGDGGREGETCAGGAA